MASSDSPYNPSPDPINGWPNPLDQFASYNYIFTLSAIRKQDLGSASAIINQGLHDIVARSGGIGNNNTYTSIQQGINANVSPTTSAKELQNQNSYLNALAGNANSSDTAILNAGYDIFFQKVTLDTVCGNNEYRGMSNLVKITMELYEPLGVSLYNKIRAAALNNGYLNHTDAPFLLTLEFKGYDEYGNVVTPAFPNMLKRIMPIKLINSEMQINESGSRYTVTAMPVTEIGHLDQFNIIRGTGSTLGDIKENIKNTVFANKTRPVNNNVLNSFATRFARGQLSNTITVPGEGSAQLQTALNTLADTLNKRQKDEIDKNLRQIADTYVINVQKGIADGASLNANQINGVASGGYVAEFKIGQSITDVISRMVMQGDHYKLILKQARDFWNASRSLTDATTTQQVTQAVADIKNNPLYLKNEQLVLDWFKIVTHIEHGPGFDNILKTDEKKIVYTVVPYKIHLLNAVGPGMSGDKSWKDNIKKVYDYIYTGLNTHITNLDIKYNYAYQQARNIINTQTPDLVKNNLNIDYKAAMVNLYNKGTAFYTDPLDPENLFPISSQVSVQRSIDTITTGSDAVAVNQMYDYLTNPQADMLKIEMTILGDPSFLPHDIYIPVTDNFQPQVAFGDYDWNVELGCFNYNWGEAVIKLNIKYPTDINENTGLLNTNQQVPFSGIYKVIKIESMFDNGKFTQVLHCLRYKGQGNTLQNGNLYDAAGNNGVSNTPGIISIGDLIRNPV